ncbi:hypothetical protein VNI00_017620 [Paramarasmius palmivorus]|uniref:CxC5 like cysteine cluster associated with KDZ domain-containing protein n=1 Tax=Paramarasmius palmivorus TaxID=297713 RepID=A0AAW0B7J9_9AGAR
MVYPSSQPLDEPPVILDQNARTFLQRTCNFEAVEDIEACWDALKDIIWHEDEMVRRVWDDRALHTTFRDAGQSSFPSPTSLWPPTLVCINPDCPYVKENKPYKLQRASELKGYIYTLAHGPLPIRYHHIKCEACRTSYHPDYFVPAKTQLRYYYYNLPAPSFLQDDPPFYYTTIPEVIQVSEHRFIETQLMRHWRLTMKANVSGSNIASIYSQTYTNNFVLPSWPIKPLLTAEHVYDGFKILSLLEFYKAHSSHLVVPDGLQADRFTVAMARVNKFIHMHGQPEINHQCKGCVREYEERDGLVKQVFCVVCDGITIGRPTCGVAGCTENLRSPRNMYCDLHEDWNHLCSIVGCQTRAEAGFRTCTEPTHRSLEEKYTQKAKACFQLRQRSEKHQRDKEAREAREALSENAELDLGNDGLFEGERASTESPDKKLRAQFARKKTHNEQFIFGACGMILARQTFPHSEAISLVAILFYLTFLGRRIPNFFVFDANCILSAHSKHKTTDNYCQTNCNPVNFPELLKEDGQSWYFNTSIAEQKNAWIGKFLPVVREMGAVFYEFFLNMMVFLHNEAQKEKLTKDGMEPGYWQTRDFKAFSQM